MAEFHALVDAVPGGEPEVEAALRAQPRLRGVAPCKEKSHDFLIRFESDTFDTVDDFLQTYVRTIRGVSGVEVVTDWDDHGAAVREARAKLDAPAGPSRSPGLR